MPGKEVRYAIVVLTATGEAKGTGVFAIDHAPRRHAYLHGQYWHDPDWHTAYLAAREEARRSRDLHLG